MYCIHSLLVYLYMNVGWNHMGIYVVEVYIVAKKWKKGQSLIMMIVCAQRTIICVCGAEVRNSNASLFCGLQSRCN